MGWIVLRGGQRFAHPNPPIKPQPKKVNGKKKKGKKRRRKEHEAKQGRQMIGGVEWWWPLVIGVLWKRNREDKDEREDIDEKRERDL